MAYESVNKKSSSWTPSQQSKTEASPHQSYNHQPEQEQEKDAATKPEAYSREAYDIIASRIFRTPNPAIQTKAAPQVQASELEPEEQEQESETADHLSEQDSPEPPTDNPPTLSPEDGAIQTKLTIGAPGDKYEQEADAMAEKVMSMNIPQANTPTIQSKTPIQRKSLSSSASLVQRHFAAILQARKIQQPNQEGTTPASPNLENQLAGSQGKGTPLDGQTRAFMEPRFGADLSSVRVHTDSNAVQMNQEIGAQAFTHGNNVYFGSGKYNPTSNEGKKLLAHELTHVIQQKGAIQPKLTVSETSQTEATSLETTETNIQRQIESEPEKTIPTQEHQSENNFIQAKLTTNQKVKENKVLTTSLTTITPQTTTAIQPKKQNSSPQPQENPPAQPQSAIQPKTPTSSPQPQQNPSNGKNAGQAPTAGVTVQNSDTAASSATQTASPEQMPGAATQAVGKSKSAGGGSTAKKPDATTLPSATAGTSTTTKASSGEDPDFQAVVESAKGVAAEQKKHDPAEAKAQAAQDAAESPSNEVDSKAQANQVGEMEQAQTPGFDAAGFKAKLMQRIADMAPKNLEEADNFKNNNQLNSVKSELSGQVKEEQKASQEPLEEKTKAAPDKSGIEPKQVTPLPPNESGEKTPQDIGADKAAPKSKSEAEVETPIQQDSQKLDQQMAEANITDEQLENSNEPQFQAALGAKKEAQTSAATAPQEYRKQEQDILTNAKATAVSTAQQMLQGMQQVKTEQLTQVGGKQVESKGKDEQARTKIADDINQIYNNTKTKVEQTLSSLDGQVLQVFDSGAAEAKQVFEDYVSKRMEAYKKERYDGVIGKGKWVKDKLLGLPSEVNVFYQEGRQQYINKMDGAINSVVAIVSKGITAAKSEITKGKQEVQNYINKLPQDLKAVGQEAAADIQAKFDQLEENINAKQDELVDSLAQKYQENLQAVDSRIDEMKAANSGLMQKALDLGLGVIKTINELKDMLLGALAGAAGAVVNILKNPIKFLGNLIQAVKQGFMNFVKNIGQYLQQGLIGWLTGTLGESGIQMPQSFDIKGIFSLVTQILGFTYDFIRGRAVQKIGAEKVAYLEKGEQTFQILSTQGLVGVWHLIQDKIGDIKTMVIEGIKGFVITNIVQAGVQWVLSLLTPASAFVRACKMIIDIVRFFFERGAQIASLVGAITNSITAIASGSIGAAITAVEGALGRSLPVVLGFLASLLGLGGIAGKIQGIIQKVRQPITKAVDWVIDKGAKVAKKFGDKFSKSKFGSKAIGWKNAAQQKYADGKQWVDNKKQQAQQWVDKKKQSLMDATEKQKQRLLNTKAGKQLTAVNNALNNKLDALDKKKEAFNEKLEAVKEWPNKQLDKIQDKAAELRGQAKDKFKQSKVGQKLDQKWQDTKDWAGKKKASAQNWFNDKTGGVKDKLKDKFGFGKDQQPATDQKQKDNQQKPADNKKTVEIPFAMKGERHTLFLTSGPTPSVEMASKRDRLSNKIGRAVAKLHKQPTKNEGQIEKLKAIGGQAKILQKLQSGTTTPELSKNIETAGTALTIGLSQYALEYGVNDIEEIVEAGTDPQHLESVETLVRKANNNWKKVKATYLSQPEIMRNIIAFRELEVQGIIKRVKQQLGGNTFEAEAFGSKDLTSDYDITFNARGNQSIEIQAVKLFNKLFRERWGKESGTVFDTNVYTTGHMPVGQGKQEKEEDKNKIESQMTSKGKSFSQAIQDVMSLLKIRRFMSDEQWKGYKRKMLNGIRNPDERQKLRVRLTEVDTLYKQANIQMDAKIQELNQDIINLHKRVKNKVGYIKKVNDDAEMEASNRLYEEYLEKVDRTFQKIETLKQQIQQTGVRTKEQSQKLNKLTIELQRLRSMALVFANEAYHTGGAVEHVVLNQQMKLGISVTNQQYLQSINEQTGFAVEQINHSSNVGMALWKSSKYVDRLCDAIKKIDIEGFEKPQDYAKLLNLSQTLLLIKREKGEYQHLKTDGEKSEAAKKVGKANGYTSKEAWLQAVLNLNQQVNQEIRTKMSEKKSKNK